MRLTSYSAARCGCAFASTDPHFNLSGSGEGGDPLDIEVTNVGRGDPDAWSMSRAGTLYWDDSGRKMFRRLPFRIAGYATLHGRSATALLYWLGGSGLDEQRPPQNGVLYTDPEFLPFFSETNWRSGRLTLDESVYDDEVELIWEISTVMFAPHSPGLRIHHDNTGRMAQMRWSRVEDSSFTPAAGYATIEDFFGADGTADFDLAQTSSPGGADIPGSITRGHGFVPITPRWLQTTTSIEEDMGHSYGFSYALWADSADFINIPPREMWRMEVAGFVTAIPADPGS